MKRKCKVQFYRDKKGEWRWMARSPNGRILADSGEGYKRLSSAVNGCNVTRGCLSIYCEDGVARLYSHAVDALVVETLL